MTQFDDNIKQLLFKALKNNNQGVLIPRPTYSGKTLTVKYLLKVLYQRTSVKTYRQNTQLLPQHDLYFFQDTLKQFQFATLPDNLHLVFESTWNIKPKVTLRSHLLLEFYLHKTPPTITPTTITPTPTTNTTPTANTTSPLQKNSPLPKEQTIEEFLFSF
jgi:hypothetical protein